MTLNYLSFNMTHVALVEDNIFSRKALEEKLSAFDDIHIVFTAHNGQDALEKAEKNPNIDLILMDIEMRGMNGIEATSVIKRKYPDIKIVMVTIYDNDDYIFNAIQAGADSYILKETKAGKIYETIQDTLNGGAVMSPSVAMKTLQLLKKPLPVTYVQETSGVFLSERETEILEHLSRGSTNKKIAERLFISPFTVKRHIENIYLKLQAHNRIELLEKARRNRLI